MLRAVPGVVLGVLAAAAAVRCARADGPTTRFEIEATGIEPRAGLRTARLRFWLDPRVCDERSCDAIVTQLVVDANQVLIPAFQLQLRVEGVRRWDRKRSLTATAEAHDALVYLDDARDVDWVIGLVDQSPGVPQVTARHLTWSRRSGRHVLITPAARHSDLGAAAVALRASGVRRTAGRHLQLALFLRGWLYALGALADVDPRSLMSGSVSLHSQTLSPENTRLVEIALRHRLSPSANARMEAREQLAFLKTVRGQPWQPGEKERALVDLAAIGAASASAIGGGARCRVKGSCDPFTAGSCPAGAACVLNGAANGFECRLVVTRLLGEGEPCEDLRGCVQDALCWIMPPKCLRLCAEGEHEMCPPGEACEGKLGDLACARVCLPVFRGCDPTRATSCAAPTSCDLARTAAGAPSFVCTMPGPRREGEACVRGLDEGCVRGLVCIPTAGGAHCRKPCGTSRLCPHPQRCTGQLHAPPLGYCLP